MADRRYRLPRALAASGVHYQAGGISVWNKGREATLELDGRSSHCVENRSRAITEDAWVRGVELRATGNEPGRTLELFADRMVFLDAYGARRVTVPRPARRDGPTSGELVYVAETEAHRMTVDVRPAPCADSMSGERRPATVEIRLDGKTYRGCGETPAH